MSSQWLLLPPSVEDEEAALAREQGSGDISENLRDENQPTSKRGTIDQRPIISDFNSSPRASPK
jgi:hypothetical protein